MEYYLFDTSGLVKYYHLEVGSQWVIKTLTRPDAFPLISDLTIIELYSAMARKVRVGSISRRAYHLVKAKFELDIAQRKYTLVKLEDKHKDLAIALLNKHALARALRTLDALQLVVAVDLKEQERLTYFITADERFGKIVEEEGIAVINPERESIKL